MKFKYLDHTADAKFQAYGTSLDEAFTNAALATFNLLIDPEKVIGKIEHKISLRSKKRESLLYDFLEEILFLLDVDGFLLHAVKDMSIDLEDEWTLKCTVTGDSHKNYEISGNIKSVTYNDMVIREQGGHVIIQVVLDL